MWALPLVCVVCQAEWEVELVQELQPFAECFERLYILKRRL